MPEGSRRGSQRSPSNTAAKRPSSVSSLSGIVGRMMSSGERGASSSSCTSVNTVCSDGERPASLSLSSSASSVSLQDTSHSSSSSSSSSSLPYGAVPTYSASSSSTPKRNGSDISLDLTPLVTPHGGAAPGGGGVCVATGAGNPPDRHGANQVAAPVVVAPPRQLSLLERVVLEIVETEQAYVRDLKSIVEDYLGCIIDCGSLPLKPEQVSSLFCNIEDIYEFNSDLLEDLERSSHAAAIAECFVERSEAFDIYTLYCMNYPNSVAVLRDCMKNKSLVRFFQERQTTLNHSLPLEAYLLKPVQRILKYHLLLQELSKHFDKSEPGYEVIEDALITMTAVAWYINDMKRKQEQAVRLQVIESLLVNWSGPDLGVFGELVLEGSFKVHRVKKERAFFLFDTMLLIAKKRLEQFVYSTHIFCCNLLLVETLKDSLCFKVSDQTIPKQQHVVQTKNQEEKRLWVHYLKRLIVENHPASLPQKARQVLGDNFCQTPQFDQDNLKKSSASPRPDDVHGFHRGRRQSEPPELLMYTPEKSRKTLPLLLDGNLPYRRTRRQSAPAKDIEAAFHPNDTVQAGSEGELCPADGLGSAGSSSTLASSVIEVEAERTEPGPTPQLRPNREEEEEEDDEELSPLSPPPTLSITEEILEFINQSRAREGLTAIHTNTTDQDLNQPKESQPPSNQTNFTCPLPPVACHSSPEQIPTMHQEQEQAEMESDSTFQSQTGDPGGESSLENEKITTEVQEIQDAESEVETGVEGEGETEGEVLGKEEEEEKTKDEGEGESSIHALDLHPSIPAEEERRSCPPPREEVITETTTSSTNPDPPHPPTQRIHPRSRGSHLTKRDKKIIEKIRSYYEAAAEAEEEEAEEVEDDGERGEGVSPRRRNSFSQIPSGVVKESVSRFDISGHQGEPESGRCKCETTEAIDGEIDPERSSITQLSAENDGQAEKPTSSLDFDAEGQTCTKIQDEETPNQVDLQSTPNRPDGEEAEIQDNNGKVCKGPSEETIEEEPTSVDDARETGENSHPEEEPTITKQYQCTDEPIQTSAGNPAVMNGHEPIQAGLADPNRSHNEPPTPPPATEQLKETETKSQSPWTRTKHRDLERTIGNLESLPSQIKVGRWSRQSRIVSANRVLFEDMGSDVAGIGLFEAGPVVDPLLMENSERILSKVQTMARMYSAKAGTMKVPLHQKRASNVWNQSWASGRPSGYLTQTQTESQSTQSQTQIQNPTKYQLQTQNQKEVGQSETKYGSQTHSGTKAQSQTLTQTRLQSQIQNKSQMWSQTHCQNQTKIYSQYQTKTTSREDQTIQEERTIKGTESLTNDVQDAVMTSSEPLLFGHVFVKEQPACHQTNGVTLSRPRDFISALAKERDCRSSDNSQIHPSPEENPPSYNRSSPASRRHVRTQPEEQSSSLSCSATHSPLSLDRRVTEFRDLCSNASTGRGEDYSQSEEREKRERSELSDGGSVSSTSVDIVTRPAGSDPSVSAHSRPQGESSKDGGDVKVKHEQDSPAAQPDQHEPEYNIPSGHTHNKDMLTVDVEESKGELVLVEASAQSPAESNRHTMPQSQRETPQLEEGGAKAEEPLNERLKGSSSQTRMLLHGSAVIFTEESSYNGSSGERGHMSQHMTFDPSQGSSHTVTETAARAPSPWLSVQNSNPAERLPTFTSRRPQDLPAAPSTSSSRDPVHQDSRPPTSLLPSSRPSYENLVERWSPAVDLTTSSSAFSLRHRSPSPVRDLPSFSASSVRAPPCSSPFRVVPASSPTPLSAEDTSLNTVSRAPPCFSPTPSPGRGSSSSSVRAAPPSSPTPSSSLRSSPVASSSAFTRSLAASCISQSISQSMAKKQQAPPINQSPASTSSLPTSHLRRRSPSPKLPPGQQGSGSPAYAQLGCSKDGYQHPRGPLSSLWSSCPSPSLMASPPPSLMASPPPSLSQRSPSPSITHHQPSSPSPRPSFLHSKADSNANNNNNNSNNVSLSAINPLANGSTNAPLIPQTGSHNRSARPFSASEPSSRVQSPTSPSPTPASFTRLCSPPPPQHNYTSPMANKPPTLGALGREVPVPITRWASLWSWRGRRSGSLPRV
ncbi:serine/arginine repetitive matrix protein 2 [Anoplopoma fimbria]|uniref:serine/arginine repetitive matrix protein 2 n=1 Tax=Anoplopoma fimbria TaxID=229290 RepID=UPI0023EAD859|nr:serine/arginine repetitive matrix protein 2 [Anoplopoma fimbria]